MIDSSQAPDPFRDSVDIKKEKRMTQENVPSDSQGNVDPREEKRVVTEETVKPAEQPVKETTTTETTVTEPVSE